MPGLERGASRPDAGAGDGHRDVLARLLEITRRHCGALHAAAQLPLCDGAGFEDRLHARLAALRRDPAAAANRFGREPAPVRPRERLHERAPLHGSDGGLVAWIELDALEAIAANEPRLVERAADEVGAIVRNRIQDCAGTGEAVLGRYGAESFAFMQTGSIPLEQAVALADAALESLSTPCRVAGAQRRLHPSLGITYFPQDGTSVPMLLMRASAAMRRARHYRMGYAFYSPILDAAFASPVGIARPFAHNALLARRPGDAARPALA